MNSPLVYLGTTSIKNGFLQFIKKPAKLIYAIIFIALFGFILFTADKGVNDQTVFRSVKELNAIVFGLFTLIFILMSYNGFKQGGTFFSMSDVNLLFTSTLKSSTILNYGLIKQIKVALLTGIFLIFQYAWLHDLYNINIGDILIICLFYGLTVYFGNLSALLIYSKTSSKSSLKTIAKIIYFGLIGIFLLSLLIFVLKQNTPPLVSLVEFVNSFGRYFPISGWISQIVIDIMSQKTEFLLFFLLTIAYFIFSITIFRRGDTDYYEDVLETTEASSNAISSQREGKIQETTKKNIKVGKIGIGKGDGPSVFYYKHLIENRRISALGLDIMNIVLIFSSIIFTFFMRKTEGMILGAFFFTCYMEAFAVSRGRLNKELSKPFIYLAPWPSFKKLIYCLKESFQVYFKVTLFITIATYILLKLDSLVSGVVFFLGIYSFIFLLIGVNLIMGRLFGTSSKTSWILFYILATLVFCIPGVGLSVLFVLKSWLIVDENITIILMCAIGNFITSVITFYLNRGVLEKAEYNN
ncbi:MAG: putative ABC exporter domain-containing protein [Sphaerochaetaceae bacterium]